jgi:CBS domain-containing protein
MTDGSSAPTVAELMSTPVITAAPEETLADAAARMREKHVGSVVVVQDEKPVGILTERDMIRIAAAGADTAHGRVSEWMTPNPDSVAPGVPAAEAFASLAEHGYRHIPVVDGTQLVGLVSMRDLMRIAQVQPVELPAAEIPKGLEGVVVADTTIGDVRGLEGFYHYRQYNAIELAEKRTLEDVWYMLFEGELPSLRQRDAFIEETKPLREIPV